jgi:hypothetical protein
MLVKRRVIALAQLRTDSDVLIASSNGTFDITRECIQCAPASFWTEGGRGVAETIEIAGALNIISELQHREWIPSGKIGQPHKIEEIPHVCERNTSTIQGF